MELRMLRHRALCSGCGSKLPPRTEAWVHDGADDGRGQVVCESCYRVGDYPTASLPASAGLAGSVIAGGPDVSGDPAHPLSEAAVEAVAQSVAQSVA
ncbi:MAG: hypothetical protein KA758_05825, partial [Acidimicrobiales bacterium]|nr:hypothetical protein [Acidimicrobiales bacterium]